MANGAKILFMNLRKAGDGRERRVADSRSRGRYAGWILLALMLGAFGLYWAGVSVSRHESTAGIRDLPVEARRELYVQTLHELETICRSSPAIEGELNEHCVEQARFVLELPECTDACRRTAQAILPHAHR